MADPSWWRMRGSFRYFEPELEAHYSVQSAQFAATIGLHRHHFFEIFLVNDGALLHVINGRREVLSEGTLVFIRPNDEHRLLPHRDTPATFTNLEFSRRSVTALLRFAGPGLARKALLGAPMPPCVRLSSFERQRLSDRLDALHAIPRAEPVRVQFALRCLLFELCTQYLGEPARPEGDEVPEWLVDVRKRMLRCDDLRAGLPRLLELSRRSHEYVCRAFRKHFGQTPGDFVCEVRLNYAATLLRHTQSKIATVAYDSGYNNLGHFYQQFHQRFGTTPSAFRAAGGAAPNDAVPKRRRAS